jgi:phage terminase Nu1 subunit (DNA packaging protein)
MTRADFARLKGVNKSTVTRWVASGRIKVDEKGLIDPVAAERNLRATESHEPHHQARLEQIAEEKGRASALEALEAAAGAAGGQSGRPPEDDSGKRLREARAQRETVRAEVEAMERDLKRGTLLPRSDVDFFVQDIGRTLGSLLDSLADRYAPEIAGCRSDVAAIHAVLSGACRDIRVELAGHLKRRAGELGKTT